MSETVTFLNFWLSVGTIVLLATSAALLVDVFIFKRKHFQTYIVQYGLSVVALLSVGASVVTLIYSDVFGFIPCWLCWWQRIFLYPQAVLLSVAYVVKDKTVAIYGMALSVPGLIVSLYQHYIQMGGSELVGCPSGGGDCAQRFLFEFGFVTFPLMAAALFLALIAVYLYFLPKRY